MSNMANDSDAASVDAEEQRTLDLVEELVLLFEDQDDPTWESSMAFAYGGRIPIPAANNAAQQSSTTSERATACQPVILRWDPNSESVPASKCKLQFPLDQSDSRTRRNLQQLLQDMQPTTFGYELWEGQIDMDGCSRKTYNLDPSNFACTFSPHKLGIVDDIARVLLPGLKNTTTSFCEPPEEDIDVESVLIAELYKLNVYAGPSGHFKAHVETCWEDSGDSWTTENIGSLVVCLPSIHEGGQLEVRYQGQKATFDWSMAETARPEIQWAAFHVGCENEVLPVTSGHLITLTYHLYKNSISATPPKAGNGLIDATQLPLYKILHQLFLQENFMPDSGFLGVHTSYAYPHTSRSSGLPSTLKGSDMVAWETFRSLGCDVRLRPVIEAPEFEPWPADEFDYDEFIYEKFVDDSYQGSYSDADDGIRNMAQSGSGHEEARPEEVEPSQVGEGDILMGDGDRSIFKFELPMRPLIRYDDSVAGPNNMADPEKDSDGDCPMAEGSPVSHAPSDSGRWEVDEEELQALRKETEELKSLPSSYFTGIQPACFLIPRNEDADTTAARLEQHGWQIRNLTLGNDLSFHLETNLVNGEWDMEEMLDRWIKQMPQGQEPTAQQPMCLDYEEVAWLNRRGMHKEPQISYGVYYGDDGEAEVATMYSTCGIVAYVPPFSTRRALLGNKQ